MKRAIACLLCLLLALTPLAWAAEGTAAGGESWSLGDGAYVTHRLYYPQAEQMTWAEQQNLMVRIEQDCDLYFRGGKAPCAFVDLRLYTPAPAEAKRAFAAALTRELCERFELEPDFVYMNMLELDHWVSGGGISFAPGEGGAR